MSRVRRGFRVLGFGGFYGMVWGLRLMRLRVSRVLGLWV